MRKRRAIAVVAGAAYALVGYALFRTPRSSRTLRAFEPDRTASLELDMWQAYYARQKVGLFGDLVTLLREQYHYSWAQAGATAFYLARAARTFASARTGYDGVLLDLEGAYARIGRWTNADFDSALVSRAELAWWLARHVPEEDSPDNVGRLIAEENALIFGLRPKRVLEASVLRARAGRLRDDGGVRADWSTISTLLHQSYRKLHKVVNQ